MKSLSILLNLCPPGSLLTQHMREIRAQALALLAGLLVSEGGGVTPVIVLTLEEAGLTGGGAEDRREEGGIALHCSLALAQVHLAQMQVCRYLDRLETHAFFSHAICMLLNGSNNA